VGFQKLEIPCFWKFSIYRNFQTVFTQLKKFLELFETKILNRQFFSYRVGECVYLGSTDFEKMIKFAKGKWVELVLLNKMTDESLTLRGILDDATDETLKIKGKTYNRRVWMIINLSIPKL